MNIGKYFPSHARAIWYTDRDNIHQYSCNNPIILKCIGEDILYACGCHLLKRLYNILYFLWLYDDFCLCYPMQYIKIAELDCCQIEIINIYVPSTHS